MRHPRKALPTPFPGIPSIGGAGEAAKRICPAKAGRRSRSDRASGCERVNSKPFSEKKGLFIFPPPQTALYRILLFIRWSRFGRARARRPKSTLPYSKSTLDLGCEGLIWVENGLMPSLPGGCRHALCPVTTQPSRRSSRTQTAAKRKIYFRKAFGVDLGCEDFSLQRFAFSPPNAPQF